MATNIVFNPGQGASIPQSTGLFIAASNQIEIQPGGTGNSITFTATNPAASRTITIGDPGGNDSLAYLATAQTFSNKSFSSAVAITPTSNQLSFGTTNIITFNVASPLVSHTITFPDPTSNDSVAYLGATQTISNKTLANVSISTLASDILPTTTNTYNLGSASKTFANVYAAAISGATSYNLLGTQITQAANNTVLNDNTPTNTLGTFATATNSAYILEIKIIASTGAASAAYKQTYKINNSAGTATISSAFDGYSVVDSTFSGCVISASISGTNALINIATSGVGGTSIWSMTFYATSAT